MLTSESQCGPRSYDTSPVAMLFRAWLRGLEESMKTGSLRVARLFPACQTMTLRAGLLRHVGDGLRGFLSCNAAGTRLPTFSH